MKQFQDAFPKATMWLIFNRPLVAQFMYGSVNEITDKVPTAATNFKQRFFNEDFMAKHTHLEQAGIMAHESLGHEGLMHQLRRGNRDPKLWNYACDLVINNMLLASGFSLPADGVFEYKGQRFAGKSEEFVYDFIEEEEGKNPSGIPKGYEGDLPEGDPDPEDVAKVRGKLQAAIEQHGMGSLPKAMQDAINSALNPKEKWYDWLRKYFISRRYSGCDWTSVCRRQYLSTGMIAPPFQSDTLGTVVISVDQSGSISTEVLEHFSRHINSILMDCHPNKIILQYFDTEVHDTDEFEPSDLPVSLRQVCGGGTCFIDCCAKAEEHEASVHIVLTDMYGSFPQSGDIPTIWASISAIDEAPFGEVVHIEIE